MFSAVVEFGFKDQETAESVLRSLEADNGDIVKSKVQGNTLTCSVEALSISSLRHTLDDLLACADLAVSVLVN